MLVVGAVLLGVSLGVEPGDPTFYPLTLLVAATWVLGGLASGPLHLGHIPFRGTLRRPVLTPIVLGLVAGAVFVVGALVVRQVPPLAGYVDEVLAHADEGYLPLIALVTLVNGVAEEVFFRGGLFAAIGRKHASSSRPWSTPRPRWPPATPCSSSPRSCSASSSACSARASGGILGPVLTHITWSSTMLFVLPRLFG